MSRFIDLSHDFYDGMPGFVMTGADGESIRYTARGLGELVLPGRAFAEVREAVGQPEGPAP